MSVLVGDCVEVMAGMAAASVDAIVCDPPYGLEFMGKDWDRLGGARIRQPSERDGQAGVAHNATTSLVARNAPDAYVAGPRMQAWHEAWAVEALRVLKPGGHLLAFGGTRTYHRLMVGMEDAGFEIRDCLMWLYGSGFPKSLNIGEGRGTALKPAWEPVVVARRPLAGTVAGNVAEYGTGALNIDACRIGVTKDVPASVSRHEAREDGVYEGNRDGSWSNEACGPGSGHDPNTGRWPANVVLSHDEDCVLVGERQVRANGHHPAARSASGYGSASDSGAGGLKGHEGLEERHLDGELVQRWACVPGCPVRLLDDQAGQLASGAGNVKRETGADRNGNTSAAYGAESRPAGSEMVSYGDRGGPSRFFYCAKAGGAERSAGVARNKHPTVKPIDLMRWLVRLVTPPGGRVLDPFLGSGTTGCAAVLEGVEFVGIERDADYAAIAEARIRFWREHPTGLQVEQALAAETTRRRVREAGQLGLGI